MEKERIKVSSKIPMWTQIESIRICTEHPTGKALSWSLLQRWISWKEGHTCYLTLEQIKLITLSARYKHTHHHFLPGQWLALLHSPTRTSWEGMQCAPQGLLDYFQEVGGYVMQTCFGAVLRSLTQNCSWPFIVAYQKQLLSQCLACVHAQVLGRVEWKQAWDRGIPWVPSSGTNWVYFKGWWWQRGFVAFDRDSLDARLPAEHRRFPQQGPSGVPCIQGTLLRQQCLYLSSSPAPAFLE